MISALRASASATIAGPAACGAVEARQDSDSVGVADRDRLVELRVRRSPRGSGNRSVSGRSSGTSSTFSAMIRAPPLGRELARDVHRGVGRLARDHRDEQVADTRAPAPGRAPAAPSRPRGAARAGSGAGTRRSRRSPATIQPSPTQRVSGFWTTSTRNESAGRDPAEEREDRPRDGADADVRPRQVRDLRTRLVEHPQPHDRRVRNREGQRRARASRASRRSSRRPGGSARIGAIPANRTSESHGVLKRGWSRRSASGSCR